MRLTASHFYLYHRPSRCERRIYLNGQGREPAEPGAYETVLIKLGNRHEKRHLDSFAEIVDLSSGTFEEREQATRDEVANGTAAIYQAVFKIDTNLNGSPCELVGEPDFLVREDEGYVVRDCKLSRRITDKDHPEIVRQLQMYGWLYEQTFGKTPIRLEVFNGLGDIVPVDYDGGAAALDELAYILSQINAGVEPNSPVGWTKCTGCGYYDYCWPLAEEERSVALVVGVDQGLATALRDEGVTSYDDLLRQFDESRLTDFHRPWGSRTQRVGKKASAIICSAGAMKSGEEFILETPKIPEFANYVMFDLEGLPPHLDDLDKIYLWGMQVFGKEKSEFLPAVAGFGDGGDEEGWEAFLENAEKIFAQYGDIPFVHWHHYEKTKIRLYVDRFGDPDGIAERVTNSLLDLLPITQKSIVLPIPSYSLKVVEQYIGYKRTQDEYGGTWSMAKYIEATELEDEAARDEVMDEILVYNREDLEATWAVLEWLKSKST